MSQNILDQIRATKIIEVEHGKKELSTRKLELSSYFERSCYSIKSHLNKDENRGVIAEFKRMSPSIPNIRPNSLASEITYQYFTAGSSALSILTDKEYFGGSRYDIESSRELDIPILRKDFIIDEYQIIEAKSMGADVILLIAEMLNKMEIKNFTALAHSLGMEVLLEMHHKNQLSKIPYDLDVVGINNRDLTTFKTDIRTSIEMAGLLPNEILKITESGIKDATIAAELWHVGYRGYLIGEYFLKHEMPGQACKDFIDELNTYL